MDGIKAVAQVFAGLAIFKNVQWQKRECTINAKMLVPEAKSDDANADAPFH